MPLLKLITVPALLLLLAGCAAAPGPSPQPPSPPVPRSSTEAAPASTGDEAPVVRPKSVIFLVGDGMGNDQITFARNLIAREGDLTRTDRFAFESMPVLGMVSTYSGDNFVTDSGAAATAFATGVKTSNQVIGVRADLSPLRSIADLARDAGWKTGYVTTTTVTHATPASFYANVGNRYTDTDRIAEQLLEKQPDVVMGGGQRDFLPVAEFGSRRDRRNLLEEAREIGYTVWESVGDLRANAGKPAPEKLLAVVTTSHLPYTLDDRLLPEDLRSPTLARMTEVALESLDGDPFFLMVEGGRIDHAAHGFDAAAMALEIAEFDKAIRVVLDYQRRNPDTLVLLTADHATGGLDINDYTHWDRFERRKASIEWIVADILDLDIRAGADFVSEMAGFPFTEEEVDRIRSAPDKYEAGRALGHMLGERERLGVTWMPRIDDIETKGHTGEDVPIYSIGPGSERLGGLLDNTDIPKRIAEILGWPALNP